MAYSKTEQTAFELASRVANKFECHIYDVEYVKEGSLKFLRIYADKDGGISIDDCEKISRELSVLLDEHDPIKENYILEVSSPGIERKLTKSEHFERYIGETVDVNLFKAINGSKQLTGTLKSYQDSVFTVEVDNKVVEINKKEASLVKLHFDF